MLDEVAHGRLEIAAISGSSAGAVNGALCAYGLSSGSAPDDAAKAKALLASFWGALSRRAFFSGNPFLGGLVPNYLRDGVQNDVSRFVLTV